LMGSPLSEYLKHRMEQKVDDLGDWMSRGGAENMEAYWSACGKAMAYREVLGLIEDVRNKDEDDLESFREH
jgi:hypothetical protein